MNDVNLDMTSSEQALIDAHNTPETAPEPAAVAAPAAPEPEAQPEDPAAALRADTAAARAAAERAAAAAEELRAAERAREEAQRRAAEEAANKEPDWQQQLSQLKQRLEAGDIEDDQYEAERERIYEAKTDWRSAQAARRATEEALAQRAQADQEQAWQDATNAFQAKAENAALLADPIRLAAFNQAVSLEAQKGFSNYTELLDRARATVVKTFGGQIEVPADPAAAIAAAKAERAAQAGGEVPHLHRAPTAGAAGDRDNKFAHLDDLGIDDLENAVARMDPDTLNEYLATAPGGLRDNPRGE
jgi:hypothetical protein